MHFQGIPLSSSSSMKLLGISFDGKLSIDSHIHRKLRIASCMIGVLYRLRNTLPLTSMLQLHKALIRPHLEYCSNLIDNATKKSIQLIEKLQARSMRILGCSDLLKENILPLSHRRNVGCLSLLYRYFHGCCSSELLGLIPTPHHLGPATWHVAHLFVFFTACSHTLHHQKSFFLHSTKLLNSLPSSTQL